MYFSCDCGIPFLHHSQAFIQSIFFKVDEKLLVNLLLIILGMQCNIVELLVIIHNSVRL